MFGETLKERHLLRLCSVGFLSCFSERFLSLNDVLEITSQDCVGDELGKLLANTYYQAGVDLAQSIVAGLESKLHEVELALAKITTLKGAQAYFDTVSGDVDATQRPLGTLTPRTITGPQPLEIPTMPIYGFGEDGFLKDFFDFSNIVALAAVS